MKTNVILQAPIYSSSGYGAHGRQILLDLYRSGKFNISVIPTGWGGTSIVDNFTTEESGIFSYCVTNKIESPDFVWIQLGVPTEFKRAGKINIGVTAGIESFQLPDKWADHCNNMDAVIVPSEFVRQLFIANGVKTPVMVVGEGVDISVFNPTVESKLDLQMDTKFNFLSTGQWLQGCPPGEDRKQIGLLVKTFVETFRGQKDIGLVLKTHSINSSSPDYVLTRDRIRQIKGDSKYPRIYLLHGIMDEPELAQLYTHKDIHAYVTMTSGEAWHRGLSEAVASDMPVLATGWSGHMDYLNPSLVTLFEYDVVDVPASMFNPGLYQPGMKWVVPKVDDVKRKLRRCFEGYTVAKERAVKMGELFRSQWSNVVTGEKFVQTVTAIITNATSSNPIIPVGEIL